MIWSFIQGYVGWLVAGLVVWLFVRLALRKQVKLNEARKNLKIAIKSLEIENEVQAISNDELKRRASVWVRDSGK